METNTFKIAQENLSKGERIVELLEQFGLFWNVNKVPLLTSDGDSTQFFGIQRMDTKEVFTTTKDQYQILQNWELAELITEVAGSFDMSVARGGKLNRGAKVFLQIATGELKGIGENNDVVKKYVTAMNSHDGTSSVGFGMTNTTISCSNTFHKAYRDVGSKIRHTISMKDRIDALTKEFEMIKIAEQTLYEQFFKLAERKSTTEDIRKVVNMVTNVDLTTKIADQGKYTSQQLNSTKQLSVRIAEEMAVKGDTLWGLFSGVTKYTNRDLRTPNRENGTLESKFLGNANRVDNKIFAELTK